MDIRDISSLGLSPSTPTNVNTTSRVEGESPERNVESSAPQVAAPVDAKTLETQATSVNQMLSSAGQSITFGVDETTNATVVKVMDSSTKEVIRQLPSEQALETMKTIQRYLEQSQPTTTYEKQNLTGYLFNEII